MHMTRRSRSFAVVVVVLLATTLSLVGCASDTAQETETDLPATPAAEDVQPPEAQEASKTEEPPANAPVSLKLAVWDNTETSANDSVEVWTKGLGSWYPALEYGADDTVIGPYQRGENVDVFVYPDGRDATEVKFTITVSDEMISESDRDMIQVDLYDDRLEVTSTGLPSISASFKR